MIEFLKQLMLTRANRPQLTVEEVEVQVWAFVVKSITVMVLGIAFGTLWLIGFEKQDAELAPIDAIFLEILKAIAFMGVGTMGGISGRKASNAIAKAIVGEENATK
jgi:hypothetical protein